MQLFPRNANLAKECPKGPKQVIISSRVSVGLPIVGSDISGSVKLSQRIDDVVGMRVQYVSISKETPMSIANGTLLVLSSNKLGSKLGLNPFQFALSTNTASAEAFSFSNVLAVSPAVFTNEDRVFPFEQINKKMLFTSPMPIEDFDWTVSVANGTFNTGVAFALEIIIEFYTLCKC